MKTLLVAIARNEELYIIEWLKHYQNLGFTKAVVYDNGHGKECFLKDIVSENGLSDFCEVDNTFRDDDSRFQPKAYLKAYKQYGSYFDWVAFFDLDEFLFLDAKSIDEFLSNEKYANFQEVRIHWKVFGDCGNVKYEPRPVVERFKDPFPITRLVNKQVKSIVRGGISSIDRIDCHGCTRVAACDTLGVSCDPFVSTLEYATWENARINHYRTKTIEEWIKCKVFRGSGFSSDLSPYRNTIDDFFKYNERTEEKMNIVKLKLGGNE